MVFLYRYFGIPLDMEAEGTVEAAVRTAFKALPQTKIKDTVEVLQKLTELLKIKA